MSLSQASTKSTPPDSFPGLEQSGTAEQNDPNVEENSPENPGADDTELEENDMSDATLVDARELESMQHDGKSNPSIMFQGSGSISSDRESGAILFIKPWLN